MFNRRGLNNLSATIGRFSRKFGGSSHGDGHGHGHEDFHVPEFHAKLGKVVLVTTYLWILYRFKEDRGQIFGLYKPWLYEHHNERTILFVDICVCRGVLLLLESRGHLVPLVQSSSVLLRHPYPSGFVRWKWSGGVYFHACMYVCLCTNIFPIDTHYIDKLDSICYLSPDSTDYLETHDNDSVYVIGG